MVVTITKGELYERPGVAAFRNGPVNRVRVTASHLDPDRWCVGRLDIELLPDMPIGSPRCDTAKHRAGRAV